MVCTTLFLELISPVKYDNVNTEQSNINGHYMILDISTIRKKEKEKDGRAVIIEIN